MYCAKCGAENHDVGKFCKNCGVALDQVVATQQVQKTTRTSALAITSLVLGILGFFLGFLSILAIIFGGVALNQIGKDPTLGGKGMAIAGLVLGIVMFALWIITIIWLGSFFSLLSAS